MALVPGFMAGQAVLTPTSMPRAVADDPGSRRAWRNSNSGLELKLLRTVAISRRKGWTNVCRKSSKLRWNQDLQAGRQVHTSLDQMR